MPQTDRPPVDPAAAAKPSFRTQLAATTASAAAPYGYTISLGGSIAIAGHRLPSPGLLGVLLLVTGAVVGFVALEALAQRSLQPSATADDKSPSILGNAHIPSAGGAVLSVWALLHLLPGLAGWAATGFAATVVYFVVTAGQRIATRRWTRRSPAPPAAASDPRDGEGGSPRPGPRRAGVSLRLPTRDPGRRAGPRSGSRASAPRSWRR